MKHFIVSALLTFFGAIAMAQTTGKIEGKIVNRDSQAQESATVILLRAKDSSAVKKTVTSKEGLYIFENIAEGKYIVGSTSVGHQRSFSKVIEVNSTQQAIALPPIVLIPASKELTGVVVTGKRPLIEQRIDRTIMNVDAIVSNNGTSALEVLENAPGVTVDKEGNISLKGKEGVIILIDGRPTQLGGPDLANMLRSMSASQMDQVEVMTNPPAKYDASGTSGIINIKTKKTLTAGSNGTVTATYMQGRYPKTNEGFNYNYRNSKLNMFTNLNHSYRSGFGTLKIQRNILSSNNVSVDNFFDQRGDKTMNGNSLNAKVGLDYFLSKKTTIGVVATAASSPTNSFSSNVTRILSPAKELERVTNATVDNAADWKSISTNLNLRTLLDKKGKEITADVDFTNYSSETKQLMINSYFNATGDPLVQGDTLQGNLPQDIKIYGGRIDYLHPLKKGARFEAGIKSSVVRTDNNAVYDSVQSGNLVRDIGRSNHFVYQENINAAYVNLSSSLTKKISMQLGLRLENTNAKGDQLTTSDKFDRHYTQLFPTAYFQYKANEKNNFVLNYGRRVRRPTYQSLNPFIKFIDRYTYSKGNPNLRPQLSDNFEFTHSWRNMITTTLNYTYVSDVFDGIIEQKGQEAYQTLANIATFHQYGIAVSANTPITKWWTSNANINVFNNKYEGEISATQISLGTTSFIFNSIQQFKINKTLTAEINGRFRSGWYEGVMRARPIGFVGIGFSQQILKNQGNIRVAVRDLFYTQKFRGSTKYGNVDFNLQDMNDSRVVSIGFTYRFNKGKKIAPVKRTAGSATEEQDRIEQ